MIKYPVRIGFCNALDGTYPVIDSDAKDLAICDTKDIANTIVNALNAMNEFPFHAQYYDNELTDWYYKYTPINKE